MKNNGWFNGFMGVLIFSGSLPATRIAVRDLNPLFLTGARASIAGLLALAVLLINKDRWPGRRQLVPLVIISIGVVVGFPLLSALALRYVTSAHSIVFIGLLPLATAVFGVLRGGERPRVVFWVFALLGSVLVIGYAMWQGLTASPMGDLLMLGAILLAGLGYAEGAALTRQLGGLQVISWALVLALPVMLPLALFLRPATVEGVAVGAWMGLAYVSLFSMFIGFIFWYRGLAQGGIASIGQLQLLQPFFGLVLAAWLLHEEVRIGMIAVTLGVILCVAGSRKYAQ